MLNIKEVVSFFRDSLGQFSDKSAKWLLSNPEHLRGLLEIIGSDLSSSLDFSKVERVNTTFVADNLREQESDLVFLLPFRDTDEIEVLIYILIEHQSTVDPVMGFRLLFYMCQVWDQQRQQWISENVPKSEWRFRPIIPVVFYTGSQAWQTPPSLEALMDVPQALLRFLPRFETLFLSVKTEPDANLVKTDSPFGWLMTVFKHEDVPETAVFVSALERFGEHLGTLSDSERGAWEQAIYYLYLLVFYRRSVEERSTLEQIVSEHQKALKLSEQEVELMQSMAEHYLQQGIEQGIEQGIVKGKQEAVLRLLRLRFQNVPEVFTERIAGIDSLTALDTLLEQMMTAESLDELQV